MSGFPFRPVLGVPGVPRLLVAYVLSRMPSSMGPLALILLVEECTNAYGLAGIVTGVFGLGQALASPVQGRIIDRHGQTGLLVGGAAVFAAGLVLVVVAALDGLAPVMLIGSALVAGLGYPPVASCMRVLWPRMVPAAEVSTAYTLEATVQEAVFVSGPVFTSILVAVHSAAAAVLAAAVCGLVGTVLFALTPASRARTVGTDHHTSGGGPLRSPGVRTILTNMVLVAVAVGFLQIAVASFTAQKGAATMSGWLLGVWTLGSLAGGLLYGARRWRGGIGWRMVYLLAAMGVVYALLAVVGSIPLFGVVIVFAGLPLAAWTSCSYVLIDRLAPNGTEAEAFGWMATAFLAGLFLGSATAGFVVDSLGVMATLVIATASLLTAAALTAIRVRTVTPDPVGIEPVS